MPNGPWFEIVNADSPITQGDLIVNCPLLEWEPERLSVEGSNEIETLKGATSAIIADVVVMTQACDLEHGKVTNVILCPHISLSDYHKYWKIDFEERGQTVSEKAWRSHCNSICDGFIWNMSMLNKEVLPDGKETEVRVVDFHEVFTVPRAFLESLLAQRGKQRLRLLPPYREHLSQAFARFFMRVGLPVGIEKEWSLPNG